MLICFLITVGLCFILSTIANFGFIGSVMIGVGSGLLGFSVELIVERLEKK